MMTITSPSNGQPLPANTVITFTGTNGPIGGATVTPVPSPAAFADSPDDGDAAAPGWTHDIGPLAPGTYVITFTGPNCNGHSRTYTVA